MPTLTAALLVLAFQAPAATGEGPELPGPDAAPAAGTVDVTWLANEGFLIRHREQAVLIDGFVTQPYSVYPAITKEARAALEAGRPPFDQVDVALASHVHGDHFQPAPARAFLAAVPEALFASTPQVVAQTKEDLPDPDVFGERLREVFPEPGRWTRLTHRGVEVAVMHLSHGTGRHADIQNLGHLIQVGGLTFLHVGDAAVDPANFAPYGLAGVKVDVALLPFWYWQSDEGMALIEEHLRADVFVACHLPVDDHDRLRGAFADGAPEVIVPHQRGETRRFARDGTTGVAHEVPSPPRAGEGHDPER